MNKRWTVGVGFCAALGVLSAGAAIGAEGATQPAGIPTAPIDPEVEKVLHRLERKGDTIDDLETTIHFTKIDTLLEDEQRYEGTLRFKKDKPNPRFLIQFDKHVHEGIVSRKKEWHAFDGRWYSEAREKTKQITRREILRPGEERDIFRIGEGPFPLPFGQKKADILHHFTVKIGILAKTDPNGTTHLECTPIPGTEMARKYETVHFYIDPDTDLPVRVRTVDKEEHTQITVSFPKIKINVGFAASALNLPKLSGYSTSEENWATANRR